MIEPLEQEIDLESLVGRILVETFYTRGVRHYLILDAKLFKSDTFLDIGFDLYYIQGNYKINGFRLIPRIVSDMVLGTKQSTEIFIRSLI